MITVGVVVVSYNSADLLPGLVASLPGGCRGTDWDLIVVDNASSDGSVEAARRLAPWGTVLELGRNGGYAAGLNAGVAALEPRDAYLLLNPDVILAEGCVGEMHRVMRECGAGIAVPRLVDADKRLILSQRRRPSLIRAWADALIGAERAGRFGALGEVVAAAHRYDRVRFVDWAEGSTQLVSGECWASCGPWDEGFFLYSEETEFELRAAQHGFPTVFVPTAGAQHLEGGSATSSAMWQLVQVNRARLYARQHRRAQAAIFWTALVVREGSRALLGGAHNRQAVRTLLKRRSFTDPPGPAWLASRSSPPRV